MKRMREFSAEVSSVPAARRFVVAVLSPSPEEVRHAAELLVSELATNAIRHVRTEFVVSIQASGGAIRVEVTDYGGGTPEMRYPGATEPTGRGLRIVDMFAVDWGVDHHRGGGKTVWFTLPPAG
jgi:anti-sigma regulatory factor (Ser/Thr protein kinase)